MSATTLKPGSVAIPAVAAAMLFVRPSGECKRVSEAATPETPKGLVPQRSEKTPTPPAK